MPNKYFLLMFYRYSEILFRIMILFVSINLYANNSDHFEKALTLYYEYNYQGSLNLLNNLLKDTTSKSGQFPRSKIHNLQGIIYENLGEYQNSLEHYNKALYFGTLETEKRLTAIIYLNMAYLYRKMGDYTLSIEYNKKALSFLNKNIKDYYFLYYVIMHNIGDTYYNSNQYEQALEYFKLAVDIASHHKLKGLEDTFNSIALIYRNRGQFKEANSFLLKGIRVSENDNGTTSLKTAFLYMYYGKLLVKYNYNNKGFVYYNKAYKIYSDKVGENHPAISELFDLYGQYYQKLNDFNNSLKYFQKSLIAKITEFNDTSVVINPSIKISISDIQLLDILKNKAYALAQASKFKNDTSLYKPALNTYELTIQVIENLRAGYLTEQSRLDLNNREKETFVELVNTCYDYYKITGDNTYMQLAFIYSEKSKYASMQQAMNELQALKAAGIPAGLIEKESVLRGKIGAFRKQILDISSEERPDTALLANVNNMLFTALREKEHLVKQLEKEYPVYQHLKYTMGEISLEMVRNKLGKKEALVEFFFADSVLYTFLLTKNNSKLYRQPADSIFYANAIHFKNMLHAYYEYDFDLFCQSSHYLYSRLIAPLYPDITGKDLIIVPDGILSYCSFDAMTTSPIHFNGVVDYSRYPYLLYKHSISYSLSASMLIKPEKTKQKWHNNFTGFAPDYTGHRDSLDVLPDIAQIISRYAQWMGGKTFTGTMATESSFKGMAPGNDIIHLVTHGSSDTLNPLSSKLYFDYRGDSLNDGYLYLYEAYNLDLKSNFIVLPACYSGYGKLNPGEGVESFAQGLQRSGNCPSMLISLWTAEHFTTTEIMDYFYSRLLKGMKKDRALQKAKIKYIKQSDPVYAHPRFWATLVIVGENDALYVHIFWKVFGVVLTLSIPVFIVVKNIKRKKGPL